MNEWNDLTKRLYWLAMPNQKQLVAGHAKGSWGRSCYSARLPGEYQHFKISSQFVWKRHVRSTELVANEDETFHEAQKRNKNSKEAKVKMLKYCELWHLWHMTVSWLSRGSYTSFLCRSFHQNVRIQGSGIRPVAASTSSRCRLADVTDGGGAGAARIAVRNWALCVSCICTSFSTSKTQRAASL